MRRTAHADSKGPDLPESSKRNQKAIKDLIQEREVEKTIHEQVEQRTREQVAEEAKSAKLRGTLALLGFGGSDGK